MIADSMTHRYRFLVLIRVTGGEAPGGSSLAPKIGPLGLVKILLMSARSLSLRMISLVSEKGG